MNRHVFSRAWKRQLVLPVLLVAALASCGTGNAPTAPRQVQLVPRVPVLLKGKTASLSWIYGRDCSRGVQAYLQSAGADPDAALVGTGWVDPARGTLINGHNTCVPGSLSMDSVVQLIHSKGGMAYLTITMNTEGPDPWSTQQAAAYIDKATTDQSYIDAIVHEVVRAGYDGVIMDLEGVDHNYPAIQQVFATYNLRVWTALKAMHRWYGIALIPKLRDNDYNYFENWRLLEQTADFVVIMAVDESYYTPGPAVSLGWLKELFAYAQQTMPGMLARIIWELPLYGDTWHWAHSDWVFDHSITYQAAQALLQQAMPSRLDTGASDLQDPYAPHFVYTDPAGVKHDVWFATGASLYAIIADFWRMVKHDPCCSQGRLQIAVWWRTTEEPPDFWPLLDELH